jgi:hypothetical protein
MGYPAQDLRFALRPIKRQRLVRVRLVFLLRLGYSLGQLCPLIELFQERVIQRIDGLA